MTTAPLASGVEVADLDAASRPQDDLYRYVNARWFERTEIPEDKSRYGTFDVLFDDAERAVRDIVESAGSATEGSESRKVGDLFACFLDEERVNARGAEPTRAPLTDIDRVTSISDLLQLVGQLQRQGLAGFYDAFVNNDPGDPDRYLVFVEQGGLSLPDESYYREAHFAAVREAFVTHVARTFELAGRSGAEQRAERVFALETEIASHHWDNVASRDIEKTYNLLTWQSAAALFTEGTSSEHAEAVSLESWVGGLALPAGTLDEIVLRQPSFTSSLAGLLEPARLDAWKDWLAYQVLRALAPYLSSDFVDEHFAFYGRTLTGAPALRERWKRAVAFVEGAMGEAVGRIYVERHYPPAVKDRMDALVANLIGAYRQSITSLPWMGDATRQRALDKLAAFRPKIGYPVRWRDYSTLVVDPSDLIANLRSATEFEFRREIAKIGQPVDRDEWFMTPQTINAYYNPGFNEIVFPAAILQPPFFDAARDEAANYGAIGAVIGHEIGHGFDDQGSKFDGAGRLRDWWEPSDRSAFEQMTHSLIDQYDALSPRETPDLHVNGALTIGENIGDLGGLGIAWKAYRISLGDAQPPVIDGLTGAQRFFLSWARTWRLRARREEVERLLAIDPHSPDEFRCNQIARNLDAFYATFDVSPSDAMWLEPSSRVTIW